MKEKIREIMWDFVAGEVTDSEAVQQILDLFAVVEQSEQLPCPHCGQLEPCAGNSPETCYHPKVC